MASSPRVNWSLIISVITLLSVIVAALIGHIVMTERRLSTLESEMQRCLERIAP